jgi:hypothetical protein
MLVTGYMQTVDLHDMKAEVTSIFFLSQYEGVAPTKGRMDSFEMCRFNLFFRTNTFFRSAIENGEEQV